MTKTELCSMTWTEASDAFKQNPVILLPMGSIEQHGPQTPVGDYRYAAEIARRIAERTGAVSCPVIPWGYSEYFKPFPGTISLRPETLSLLVEDHLDCLLRYGLDHILFICGHRGNLPVLEQVARKVRRSHGVRVATIDLFGWCGAEWKRLVYGSSSASTGHGSDPMQSLAMHLFPEEVRLDLIEPGNDLAWQGLTFQGVSTTSTEGFAWHLYMDYNELTPTGVAGDPRLASAAVGEKTLDYLVDAGAIVVRRFADLRTRVEQG